MSEFSCKFYRLGNCAHPDVREALHPSDIQTGFSILANLLQNSWKFHYYSDGTHMPDRIICNASQKCRGKETVHHSASKT